MESLEHDYVETNGVKLHVVKQGPEDGAVILMLHGFPEYWYGWRKQMSFLAAKGYRVWVPDQRGYNLSDKPEAVNAYHTDELVQDVAGLIEATGKDKVTLVGHDWGGIVAWQAARACPERIGRLVILNAPHEAAMTHYLPRHPFQLIRSSYIFFFLLRGLPEKLVEQSDWKLGISALKDSSNEGTFTQKDLELYKKAWSQPFAMRSMINWYRANLKSLTMPELDPTVTVPTLIIWGRKDQFLGAGLAEKSLDFCENGKGILLGEATHWVHHEEPDRVNNLILDFIEH